MTFLLASEEIGNSEAVRRTPAFFLRFALCFLPLCKLTDWNDLGLYTDINKSNRSGKCRVIEIHILHLNAENFYNIRKQHA